MRSPPRATRLEQALWAAGLSLLFLGIYGTCNSITARRGDVGTLVFDWERHIPIVPILILPYMSIDLFFVGAPFLCGTRRELATFGKRVALGIAVAAAGFLLFPLTYAFDRPQVDGPLGRVFALLHGFDKPYNMLPSLHIILRTILAQKYAEKTRGALRVAVQAWFVLIGFSTVLVGQHHVMDVVAGFAVGAALFFFVRDEPGSVSRTGNPRIAAWYGAGALALAAAAWAGWPWSAPLLWPIASLAIVAAGYCGLGARIVGKRGGRLPFSSKLLLGPWLLGQRLSLRHYAKQCEPWSEVAPRLWIGRVLDDAEARTAVSRGVTAVLDLTAEFDEAQPFREVAYLNVQVLDLTAPSPPDLERALEFVARESERGVVYVHCKIGYSRSAAVAGAWLLRTGEARGAEEAVLRLRAARPTIVVRREVRELLERTAARRLN